MLLLGWMYWHKIETIYLYLFDIITGDTRDHIVDRPHQLAKEANILNKHNVKVSYKIGVKLAKHLQEVIKN